MTFESSTFDDAARVEHPDQSAAYKTSTDRTDEQRRLMDAAASRAIRNQIEEHRRRAIREFRRGAI